MIVRHSGFGDNASVLEFRLDERALVEPLREGDTLVFSGRLREALYLLSNDQVPMGFAVDSVTLLERLRGPRQE